MEFVVDMVTTVQPGTSDDQVADTREREALTQPSWLPRGTCFAWGRHHWPRAGGARATCSAPQR